MSALAAEKTAGRSYRLPTEAECEYACRARTTTATHYGDSLTSSQANFDGNYSYGSDEKGSFLTKSQQVGSYPANAFGLFDMHGNVWEWCADWYSADYYMSDDAADPAGPETGTSHVVRGGSWYNFGYACRSAYRSEFTPPLNANIYGFRVVASIKSESFEATDDPPALAAASSRSTTTPSTMKSSGTMSMPAKPDESGSAMMAPSTKLRPPSMAMGSPSMNPTATGTPTFDGTPAAVASEHAPDLDATSETAAAVSSISVGDRPVVSGFILLMFATLILLTLLDTRKLKSLQNGDLLLLLGLWFVCWFAPSIHPAIVLCVSAPLLARIYQCSKAPLPTALNVAVWPLATALTLMFVVRIYQSFEAAGQFDLSNFVIAMLDGSIVAAMILLGKRWHDVRFGLSLAAIYCAFPLSAADPSILVAAIASLAALYFVGRPLFAGAALGLSLFGSVHLLLLLPL